MSSAVRTVPATYASPIVAVDQVVTMSEHGIRTIKAITGNETFFLGHYPGFPIFPGVFVLEAVHQAIQLFTSTGLSLQQAVRLVEIKSVRFLSPLAPGDVLIVDAECVRDGDDGAGVAVDARCWREANPPVAVARMKLRYGPRD